jgi:hypothetical protein
MPCRARQDHPPRQLRDDESLDAGAHALHPAELGGEAEQQGGELPRIEDFRLGDEVGGFFRGRCDADAEGRTRKPDQLGVAARLRRVGVVHEDGARDHAPSLARSWSSNVKSIGRSRRPEA